MSLSPEAQALAMRLRDEFPYFAENLLKIRTKTGDILPLAVNRAQIHLAAQMEAQRQECGKVRILVLKGRQQGISTFIEAWLYWKLWGGDRGKRAFILTHEQKASDNLFEMANRYHTMLPEKFRPATGASNAKELYFSKLDSGYQVATAGSKDTGRSATAQYFHGSEVAFWDNAESHMSAIGQIVPDLPGTVIVLESTANGMGNLFHRMWQAAEKGESDYRAVFIPWFWSAEYRRPVPSGWVRTDDEDLYARAHGVDNEQLAWRRAKIASDFAGDEMRFRQEYPATAAEAFVMVGHEPYIAPSLVLEARAGKDTPEGGPLIIGVDPARFGDDSTGIVRRRGRRVLPNMERLRKLDSMAVAGRLAVILRAEAPERMFIDLGGQSGAAAFDRLGELGFGHLITGVNFGGKADHEERYANKRAEMWGEMRDWLKQPPCSVPADDGLLGDLTGPKYSYDSQGRLKLESKDDMRKRGVKSPDIGDALALTFAQPVASAGHRNTNAWTELEEAWGQASDTHDMTGFETG